MNSTPTEENTRLRILSLNCQKSPDVLLSLINNTNPQDWDILCIQEPPTDIRTRPGLTNRYWTPILPPIEPDHHRPIRSLILINSFIPTSNFTQIRHNHPDITAVLLRHQNLLIISIYNPPDSNDTIHHQKNFLGL